MNYLVIFTVLLLTVSSYICIQALECGIDTSSSEKNLKQIVENCKKKKEEADTISTSSSSEESEESQEGSTEPSKAIRNKRHPENITPDNVTPDSVTVESNDNSTDTNNCIVHCILSQLGMTDNGFPDHHKVSEALLRSTRNRELRDFIQETTDDCFQLIDQGEQQEPCQYSITLVTCLSERGKANCADWPIGNLSFLSNKNEN